MKGVMWLWRQGRWEEGVSRGRAGVGWRELIAVMMLEESVMYVPEGRRMVGIV